MGILERGLGQTDAFEKASNTAVRGLKLTKQYWDTATWLEENLHPKEGRHLEGPGDQEWQKPVA